MEFLGLSNETLHKKRAAHTAKEIVQQPHAWLDTVSIYNAFAKGVSERVEAFLTQPGVRIIFTGAGTSAFIGGCVAPLITERRSLRSQAIATTDLVSNPYAFFERKTPTLLVSFARSGNSPESLAAVQLADQCVSNLLQLIITCDENGALYQYSLQHKHALGVLTPTQTNDQSFAMTSSFSSMLLMAQLILNPESVQDTVLPEVFSATETFIANYNARLQTLASVDFTRVVYLGSGSLLSLAEEAALKLLELTDGATVALHNSPLGFRHGPKTIIDKQTLVVVFLSSDPYTRKYDVDLLNELRADNEAAEILAISDSAAHTNSEKDLILGTGLNLNDGYACLPFITAAQMYAFHRALALGNSPDSPSVSGTVNRVVKGVTIYPLSEITEAVRA